MSRYAAATGVSVEKSKAQLERLLSVRGATRFFSAQEPGRAMIGFQVKDRVVRLIVPLPERDEFKRTPSRRWMRSPEEVEKAWEQACRARWRALVLIVKARFEAIEAGISTFEREFLADLLLPEGMTVSERIAPQLEQSFSSGRTPHLLGGLVGGSK